MNSPAINQKVMLEACRSSIPRSTQYLWPIQMVANRPQVNRKPYQNTYSWPICSIIGSGFQCMTISLRGRAWREARWPVKCRIHASPPR